MADVPGTWLDERVQPKPEPEDAGVAAAAVSDGVMETAIAEMYRLGRAARGATLDMERAAASVIEHLRKQRDVANARAEGLANLLRDLLEPIEGRWVDENYRDRDALRIRRLLDLCSTGGCTNKRGPEEADGFCYECCNDGEWPDADTWSEERKARAALAGDAPGRGEG